MTKPITLIGFLSAIIFISAPNKALADAPQLFMLQGTILTPAGLPQEASNIDFTIEIRSPGMENCLLYREGHTLNMSNSGGAFSLGIGGGSRSGAGFQQSSTLREVFNNAAANRTGLDCENGADYDAASGDSRKIAVSFDDGSGPQTLTQVLTVQAVPYSLYAENSSRLGGLLPTDLLQVNILTRALSQMNLESVFFDQARVDELNELLDGTSQQYLNTTSALSFGDTITMSGAGNSLVVDNGATFGGVISSSNTTPSNSPSTGALVVSGGVGVTGAINSGTTVSAATSMRTPIIYGSSAASGTLTLESTSDATKGYVLINPSGGNVGIGATNPSSHLDVNGAVTQRGMAVPAVSPAGQGRIYFDSGTNKFRVSQNGGAYADLVGSGGASTIDALTDAVTNYSTTYNMFLGSGVGASTSGTRNTALGAESLQSLTTGSNNTAFGNESLKTLTTGSNNTGFGREALAYTSTGEGNTAVGMYAIGGNSTGSHNTGVGDGALGGLSLGSENAAVGNGALGQISGQQNTALGFRAGYNLTAASDANILIGYLAGPGTNQTFSNQLWINTWFNAPTIYGDLSNQRVALGGVTNPSTTLDINGAVTQRGMAVPAVSPAGQGRIYFDSGTNKFRVSQNGGAYADLVSGSGGTFLAGNGSGSNPSISFLNKTDTGFYYNGTGSMFLAIDGNEAMQFTSSSIDSYRKIRAGNCDASQPCFSYNTDNDTGMHFPAANAVAFSTGGTERVRIDSSGHLDVTGDVRIASNSHLYVGALEACDSTGCQMAPSDARYKENIAPLENSLENILKLQGVSYDWIDKKTFNDRHQIGFIAQDLEKVYPEVVRTNEKTGMKSVMYANLIAPLVEAVKSLYDRVRQIGSETEALRAENEKLKQDNAAIKAYLCAKDANAAFCK